MLEYLLSGNIGQFFVNLALVSALLGAVAFILHGRGLRGAERWRQLGYWSFGLHALSVLGILVTLLGLIFTRQYQYHYVWSHASNELQVHYIVACLWEGQEGSFLIWMFWHSLLGGLVAWRAPRNWRAPVLGVILSVETILASMLLGVVLPEWLVLTLLGLLLLAAAGLGLGFWARGEAAAPGDTFRFRRLLQVLGGGAVVLAVAQLLLGQAGWLAQGSWHWSHVLMALWLAALAGVLVVHWRREPAKLTPAAAQLALLGLLLVVALVPLGSWQVGSTPFLLLREAMPNAPIFATNPDFVPENGTGLNPLLQNYWMVIHPPTLFLGFAGTLIPFAFVMAGLLKGDYTGWVKPASGWSIFAVMILGIGIIMGGYWAYETLNFGGYWNWDPVENASFVPWLTGVAALHTLVAWRSGKHHLPLGMLLLATTFILVLYSTFLTRSGILGDSSVHSFTDLGLSGQLLVLLLVYLGFVALVFALRWKALPHAPVRKRSPKFLSKEVLLFVGVMALCFAAIQITFTTSLPVINKVFGTNLAPPAQIQYFYYKWNVWFGIGIGVLSALGQFVYWRGGGQRMLQKFFVPFLLAVAGALAIMVLLFQQNWEFVFHNRMLEAIADTAESGWWSKFAALLQNGPLLLADELLLLAGLLMVLANGAVLVYLLRKKWTNLRFSGGALAHVGFGLMLVGMLFSAGFEWVVSKNLTPEELGSNFPEESRKDNVLIVRSANEAKPINGYWVGYRGKLTAAKPLEQPRIVFRNPEFIKVKFEDARGDFYTLELGEPFIYDLVLTPQQRQQDIPFEERKIELDALQEVISNNLELLEPRMLNERSRYALEFFSMPDSAEHFFLYPEAEVSDNMGLVAHPDRDITLDRDLYVHVTSIPLAEADGDQAEKDLHNLSGVPGDTFQLNRSRVIFDGLVKRSDVPDLPPNQQLVVAKMRVQHQGAEYLAEPMWLVSNDSLAEPLSDRVQEAGLWIEFYDVDMRNKQFLFRATEEKPTPDYITIKALHKPWINLLWLGTFILAGGFGIALVRRVREARGLEAPAPQPDGVGAAASPAPAATDSPVAEAPAAPAAVHSGVQSGQA